MTPLSMPKLDSAGCTFRITSHLRSKLALHHTHRRRPCASTTASARGWASGLSDGGDDGAPDGPRFPATARASMDAIGAKAAALFHNANDLAELLKLLA